jgi:hypothetical protein
VAQGFPLPILARHVAVCAHVGSDLALDPALGRDDERPRDARQEPPPAGFPSMASLRPAVGSPRGRGAFGVVMAGNCERAHALASNALHLKAPTAGDLLGTRERDDATRTRHWQAPCELPVGAHGLKKGRYVGGR